MKIYDVIKRPIVTEKTAFQRDANSTYVFEVSLDADKPLIKDSVEKLFEVKVGDVRTVIMPGKYKRFGKHSGKTKRWKKAYVTLKEGNIELFEGV